MSPLQQTKGVLVFRAASLFLTIALVLAMGWINSPSGWAASCKDYKTQQEAQKAADTLDPDGDGKYCEDLPDDKSAASGSSQTEINARKRATAKKKLEQKQAAQRRAAARQRAATKQKAAKRRAAQKRAAERRAAKKNKGKSGGEGDSGGLILAGVLLLLALALIWSIKEIIRRHKDKKMYRKFQQEKSTTANEKQAKLSQARGAGWYLDPRTAGQMRWWDGQKWSEETRPAGTQPEGPASVQQRPNRPVQSQQPRQAQPTAPPPGWHPDPSDPNKLRWWDGSRWTENTHPRSGQPPSSQ